MKILIYFVFVLVIISGSYAAYNFYTTPAAVPTPTPIVATSTPTVVGQATYQCDGDKILEATFFEDAAKAVASVPGEPPVPIGSVNLSINGVPSAALMQTISADGARYATPDDSFVFWSKGNEALVLEEGEQKNYTGCIVIANDPGGLPEIYASSTQGFSLRYPADFTVDDTYQYDDLGPDKIIPGIKFTIAESMATSTNLSSNSYLSIEHIESPDATCTPEVFLSSVHGSSTPVTSTNDVTYLMASSTEAAAGNRYEEYVFTIEGLARCQAIRYFIHYGVFENYEPGTVTEFDTASLLSEFDKIRDTVIFN